MSDREFIDTCVVGAGVVGLAVARQLALSGRQVMVLEKLDRFGEGISSRNSEVIHAGIYYPAGSLKAELCVRGKTLLYDYCGARNISHQRIGKLIVATSAEEDAMLAGIQQRASENGVDDLEVLDAPQVLALEPMVRATSALMSPSTGIISAAELMTAFLGDIEGAGGALACHAEVTAVYREDQTFVLNVEIEQQSFQLGCRSLINCAGLDAQRLASSISGFPPEMVPERHLCRGNYFVLPGKNPFRHLIYPVPDPSGAGLGVHATIDVGGQVKFGPDVEYIDEVSYEVSDERLATSYDAIRRYFPGLQDNSLVPGYAGIRPKLQGAGENSKDFLVQGPATHGVAGLVNLFGIESPGLTSSMAIAETVVAILESG